MAPRWIFKAGFDIKYYQKLQISEGKSANSEIQYTFFNREIKDEKTANNEGHLYTVRIGTVSVIDFSQMFSVTEKTTLNFNSISVQQFFSIFQIFLKL